MDNIRVIRRFEDFDGIDVEVRKSEKGFQIWKGDRILIPQGRDFLGSYLSNIMKDNAGMFYTNIKTAVREAKEV